MRSPAPLFLLPLLLGAAEGTMMSTRQTVQSYFDRLVGHQEWEGLFSGDVVFTSYTSPVRELRGKEAFLQGTKRFYGSVTRAEVRELVVEGDKACAFTHYELQPPGGAPSFSSDVAERFTVRDGKITAFAIYFDSAPFPR